MRSSYECRPYHPTSSIARRLSLPAGRCLRSGQPFAGSATRSSELRPLEIVTKSGVQVFSVEMATTEEEKDHRADVPQGIGRRQRHAVRLLAGAAGLDVDEEHLHLARHDLHPRRRPHPAIAENTEPLSTKIISSGGLAKGVLEVIAGTAQKYGIAPGDRVAHPLFNRR